MRHFFTIDSNKATTVKILGIMSIYLLRTREGRLQYKLLRLVNLRGEITKEHRLRLVITNIPLSWSVGMQNALLGSFHCDVYIQGDAAAKVCSPTSLHTDNLGGFTGIRDSIYCGYIPAEFIKAERQNGQKTCISKLVLKLTYIKSRTPMRP